MLIQVIIDEIYKRTSTPKIDEILVFLSKILHYFLRVFSSVKCSLIQFKSKRRTSSALLFAHVLEKSISNLPIYGQKDPSEVFPDARIRNAENRGVRRSRDGTGDVGGRTGGEERRERKERDADATLPDGA